MHGNEGRKEIGDKNRHFRNERDIPPGLQDKNRSHKSYHALRQRPVIPDGEYYLRSGENSKTTPIIIRIMPTIANRSEVLSF